MIPGGDGPRIQSVPTFVLFQLAKRGEWNLTEKKSDPLARGLDESGLG